MFLITIVPDRYLKLIQLISKIFWFRNRYATMNKLITGGDQNWYVETYHCGSVYDKPNDLDEHMTDESRTQPGKVKNSSYRLLW